MGTFKCADGREFNSLKDLALSLDDMDDGVFMHHVNEERNDFEPWIRETFDGELADTVKTVDNKREMAYQIMKYLVQHM
ncbi:MAG: hypothetical protein ACOCQX_03975 [Candidatus Nanoarchaeia archaeon]